MDIGYYTGIFLRRLPWVILFTAVGSAIGLALALALPPSYQSEAELVVESQQIPDDMAASTVRTGEIEALQIIRQRILTRNNLLEMANRFDIYDGEDDLTADEKVEDLRDRVTMVTEGSDNPRGSSEATIVHVAFRAETASLSAEVANELVTKILQENEQMRRTAANQTLEFFDQEVADLQQSLSEVSSEILEFKESNLEALPDSLEFRRSRQAALQERLVQLERERTALTDRRERLTTMFEQTGEVTLSGTPGADQRLSPRQQRLQDLEDEYTRLSGVLSDSNPRLGALQSQIDSLRETIARNAAEAETDGEEGGDSPAQNRQATLFDMQIADIEAQIDYIEDQRETIQAQMQDLEQSIAATPSNTVTLEALERERDNLQTQYNQAVANRADAEQGSLIESLSRGRRITVVEQAVPPDSPTDPNRPVIAAAGFGGGLMLGLAVVVLLELLNSAVRRPADIRNALGVDVLATIPYLESPTDVRRRRGRLGLVVLALAILIPAGVWYVDREIRPLQPLVGDLVARINPA